MEAEKRSMEVRMVSVTELKCASFNPENRTTTSAISDLVRSIARKGILQPLLVARSDDGLTIVDGHRRTAAAVALGIDQVPIMEVDGAVAELWVEANHATKAVNGKAWMVAAINGLPPELLPTRYRKAYESVSRWFADEVDLLQEQAWSPSLVELTIRLVAYIKNAGIAKEDNADAMCRRVILWATELCQVQLMRSAVVLQFPAEAVWKAISAGERLTPNSGWWTLKR